MPEVAANATEAVLAEWMVGEHAEFAAGGTIATVETEKALVDVEAEAAGVVLKALVPPGAQVEVGAPIAVLGAPGESVGDLEALLAELGVEEPVDHVVPERREVPVDPGAATPLAPEPSPGLVAAAPAAADGRVFSSPLARKLAKQAGLTLADLTGTGPRGRILRRDVEAVVAARREAPASSPTSAPVSAPAPSAAGASSVPHSRMRRATAERLAASKREAPHFYLRATVRAERLLELRAELDEAGVRVSVNDLLLKAVAAAHRRVPEMNVVWTPDAVHAFDSVDVAVAVATDRGLVTPVLRGVDAMPVSAVAAAVRELAERARAGRLRQEELEGGTITVSNLGMYGVEEFAAIINPPHASILAVGAVRDEPVVEDGAVVPGKVMTVTLSVDHRPVDGVVAARWLAALVELLEHPVRVLA
jgi:pyruvate dehydrogenase E2 component (dihydrolipoamide acetyltransferase)